jgi:flagellar hook-associated protein 1 FlgK
MSGLLTSLSSAAQALDAQRMGLDVTGQNLANINTEGYTRRTLLLAERPPTDPTSAGRGVEVLGIRALRDRFVEGRIQRESQNQAHDRAVSDVLGLVEAALGRPGESLDVALTNYFDAFAALADDPTSAEARDNVIRQGQELASAFNDMAGRLDASRRNTDAEIRGDVEQVNALAAEVARLNGLIGSGNGVDVETLRDRRSVAIQKLAELAGAAAMERPDGIIDLSVGSGRPLVIGATAYPMSVGSSGSTGLATIVESGGATITSEITTGRIGGLLEARDSLLPDYQNRLDQLAFDVSGQINALHQAGYDELGGAGLAFFTPPAAVAGAAANMTMNAAIAADNRLVAASSTGAVGDNGTAQAIAGLRDARVAVGGSVTPSEGWAQIVYRIGSDSAVAQASQSSRQLVVDQLNRLRDATSGVSIDEEAATLMKFQRAYEANARYFVTINSTLETLMQMVGVV